MLKFETYHEGQYKHCKSCSFHGLSMSQSKYFNNTVSYIGTHWKSLEHDLIYKKKTNHAYTPNDLVILITHFFYL